MPTLIVPPIADPRLVARRLHEVFFIRDHFAGTGAGYPQGDKAAFRLEAAIELVARGVAEFSDSADLEANREAIEVAKRRKPTLFPRRMIPGDPRHWG